LLDAEQNIFLH